MIKEQNMMSVQNREKDVVLVLAVLLPTLYVSCVLRYATNPLGQQTDPIMVPLVPFEA